MTITIYELLGLVKDGKAPKKIKYDGMIWNFEKDNLYYSDNVWLDDYCNISQTLNEEVEILEEENKIEKLYHCCMESDNEEVKFLIKNINDLCDKFNEVIDEINKLKENK